MDITRFGATTKPLPSNTFWQLGETPRILTTLDFVAATTGLSARFASGASTGTISSRPNGCVAVVVRSRRPSLSPQPDTAVAATSKTAVRAAAATRIRPTGRR